MFSSATWASASPPRTTASSYCPNSRPVMTSSIADVAVSTSRLCRRPRARQLTPRRSVPPRPPFPDDSQSSGQLPQLPRLPPEGGAPPKTERPELSPADRPIDHHVAGPKAEHRDKPGRPRNDRTHTTPYPLAPITLTEAPVQISDSQFGLSSDGRVSSAGGERLLVGSCSRSPCPWERGDRRSTGSRSPRRR
jgi:hypothetical protein